MKKLLLLFLTLNTFSFTYTITIAVATNVSYAIKELTTSFTQLHPDIKVRTILGSSGKLTAQIEHHAPYGLFMSANMFYPDRLYKKGLTMGEPMVYAQGGLALFSSKKQKFSLDLTLLTQKKIRRIALANPKTAPYGEATKEALKKAKLYELLKPKFVYAESISQTLSYARMATDMGIVAKSSLFSKQMKRYKKGIYWKEIDKKFYTPISQGMVLLKNSKNKKDYQKFYDFMLSKKAKDILLKYGYNIQ